MARKSIAGNLHPDHDTIATFGKRFLDERKDFFVQILLMAEAKAILEQRVLFGRSVVV